VPLSASASSRPEHADRGQPPGMFVASTLSFNWRRRALDERRGRGGSNDAMNRIGVPALIRNASRDTRAFPGIRRQRPSSSSSHAAVYVVLGISMNATTSDHHSSKGIGRTGAVLALMVCNIHRVSIIALIGVIMMIGIVKKEAIMMIDFALEPSASANLKSRDAIFEHASCDYGRS